VADLRKQADMTQPNDTSINLAWAAGFYDGEGSSWTRLYRRVWRGRNHDHRTIACSVGQVDREVLDRFSGIVGVGSVDGPYDKGATRSPMFYWRTRSLQETRHVYELLRPYLGSIKIAQFERAFAAYDSMPLIRRKTADRRGEIEAFLVDRPGATQREIGRQFGITQSRVSQVMSGRTARSSRIGDRS
jgi:hypothetical protein